MQGWTKWCARLARDTTSNRAAQAQQHAQDEAQRDAAAAINHQVVELANRLDGLVEEANQRLLETPILIQKLTSDHLVDAATGQLRSYQHLDKSLDLGFLAVSPSDTLVEYDPMPGVTLPYHTKKMATREVTVDGGAIVAIGFLKLSMHKRERSQGVSFIRPVSSSYNRGLHFLLLRVPQELYGTWKTCEFEDQPLVSLGQVRQRIVLSKAREVVEAVEARNSIAQYVVKLRGFTNSDFVSMLTELVSS